MHYIHSHDGAYSLTPQGTVISSQVQDHIRAEYLFSKSPSFWSTHYLEALPGPFLRDIGDLCNATVVETSNTDIFSSIERFSAIIENAERISVVSSFMSHLHADTLVAKVKEGVPVEMVVNTEIAGELRKEPFMRKIRDIAAYDRFRVYVAPAPLHMGLTVTDSTLSFGLCHPDDLKYDILNDLIATDRQAIKWGERLFSYYREISEETIIR